MIILGIETSCDETAASLIQITNQHKHKNPKIRILSNVVASQVNIHRKYGGIVPEVAARAHCEKIIPVLKETLSWLNNPIQQIDLIAVTNGPGLITSLLVGVETAKTLSYLWQKPLLPINHLVGHIYAAFVNNQLSIINNKILFPAVCLIVSGGHTELILMSDYEKFKKIGETLDDAAGECFDKVAKLLQLGYPGGPAIAKEASKANLQSPTLNFQLPRPMIKTKDYNFSFSGLKTAVLYKVKDFKKELKGRKSEIRQKIKKLPQKIRSENKNFIANLSFEVQQAIIDVLIKKTLQAVRNFNAKTVILCGGVAANEELRKQLAFKINNLLPKINFLVPSKNLCTDNAVMIASAAHFKWQRLTPQQRKKLKNNWQKIVVDPNLEIKR